MRTTTPALERRMPIGAELLADGTAHFRVWAPRRKQVEVAIADRHGNHSRPQFSPLAPEGNGYHSGFVDGVEVGTIYGFRLDHSEKLYYDPASRFQPQGPVGLSQLIDPAQFTWTDDDWRGVGATGQVLYEMHIGTFTPEGTWAAAARELPELADAGITIIEVLPVADFPGRWGWGYDGVCMFAPSRLYGEPDDFRRFVDQAHAVGLGVILDVVYNHFGNAENYMGEFAQEYYSTKYKNEWASAINFEGKAAQPVREYFIANARYWIDEYHIDGYRFDATQAIFDESPQHILADLTTAAREAAEPRSIYMIAENEPQQVRTMRPADEGGHGMDAAWNDDFHHTAMVRLTGKNQAYYSDYLGHAQEFISALKHGFIYQGQLSQWQKNPRGTPTRGFPATAFVTFLQNHDQVANSATGQRVHELSSPGRLRAMTALWLLSPQTPLFFQGQEFAASSPFLYFADYSGDMAQSIREGRGKFLAQFPSLATPEAQAQLIDPTLEETFTSSKLNFDERETHRHWYDLHKDLLKLRRDDAVFRSQRADLLDAAVLGPDALVVRYFGPDDDDRLLLVNFGCELHLSPVPQPLMAPPAGKEWDMLWTSDDPRYGAACTGKLQVDDGWQIPGETTVVLKAEAKK